MFSAQATRSSPPPPPSSRLYLPRRARAARDPEYRGLLMFPDCLAQPANISWARYPCSRAVGEEAIAPAGPQELQLTPRGEAAAGRARAPGSSILLAGRRFRCSRLAAPSKAGFFLRAQGSNPSSRPKPRAPEVAVQIPCLSCSQCRKCHFVWQGARRSRRRTGCFPSD